MKNNFMIILFLFCLKNGIAQTIADTAGTGNAIEDSQLPGAQFSDWKNIQNAWYANEYDKVKYDMKINMNCKTCTSFYVDVIIKINGNGKMEYYKLLGGKSCGRPISKAEEIRMMRMFFKFEFAASLRNTIFKTHLGTALKC